MSPGNSSVSYSSSSDVERPKPRRSSVTTEYPREVKYGSLLPPRGVVPAGTVHEQHGRAFAVNLVVDLGPF